MSRPTPHFSVDVGLAHLMAFPFRVSARVMNWSVGPCKSRAGSFSEHPLGQSLVGVQGLIHRSQTRRLDDKVYRIIDVSARLTPDFSPFCSLFMPCG